MEQELPEPGHGGNCLDCKKPLRFHQDPTHGPCFKCHRCGRLYRGAKEWTGGPT